MTLLYHHCWIAPCYSKVRPQSVCPFPFLCCKDGCEREKPQNRAHPGGTRQGRDGRGRPSQAAHPGFDRVPNSQPKRQERRVPDDYTGKESGRRPPSLSPSPGHVQPVPPTPLHNCAATLVICKCVCVVFQT